MISQSTSHRIRRVDSFDALVGARFEGDVNALCWPRQLPGDFEEVVARLNAGAGMTTIDDDDLGALSLSAAGSVARGVLLADQAMLRGAGLAPILDCIGGYPRDADTGALSTDVYSFHVDSAPVAADTYLCTYVGAASQGLPNEQADKRIEIAETRARLLAQYGGADDAGFASYLSEHHYDLHYAARVGAEPYGFGLGNLWRIAIDYPDCPVLPCIHRAPETLPGAPSRLLLIS
jgi:hypothetical protein